MSREQSLSAFVDSGTRVASPLRSSLLVSPVDGVRAEVDSVVLGAGGSQLTTVSIEASDISVTPSVF